MSGGLRLQFDFYGDEQITRELDAITWRVQNATPAFEAMRARFLDAERQQFASAGGFGSAGWPALSPEYGAWKARRFPGRPILVRTGELRRSLTSHLGVDVIEPDFAMFGSGVEYGAFHQHGGPNLPRRQPIDLPRSEREEWVKLMQRFLITGATT